MNELNTSFVLGRPGEKPKTQWEFEEDYGWIYGFRFGDDMVKPSPNMDERMFPANFKLAITEEQPVEPLYPEQPPKKPRGNDPALYKRAKIRNDRRNNLRL